MSSSKRVALLDSTAQTATHNSDEVCLSPKAGRLIAQGVTANHGAALNVILKVQHSPDKVNWPLLLAPGVAR